MLSVRCLSVCPVCDVGVLWPKGRTDQDETRHACRLGPGHIVLDGDPALPPPKGHSLPLSHPLIFGPYLLRPNGCMDQHVTWYGATPRTRRLCVRWDPLPKRGPSPPPKKKNSAHLLWPNGWMDQDGTWHEGRPQPRRLCIRWGPSPPPQKWGGAPKFSGHVYCGQTAGWIKMPLGMKVGLIPGHCVLDGDPAPSHKGVGAPPKFSAHFYCSQTAECIKMPLGMEVGLSPGDFVLDGDPAPLFKQGAEPLNFRPMSVVAKRLDGSRWDLAWR